MVSLSTLLRQMLLYWKRLLWIPTRKPSPSENPWPLWKFFEERKVFFNYGEVLISQTIPLGKESAPILMKFFCSDSILTFLNFLIKPSTEHTGTRKTHDLVAR